MVYYRKRRYGKKRVYSRRPSKSRFSTATRRRFSRRPRGSMFSPQGVSRPRLNIRAGVTRVAGDLARADRNIAAAAKSGDSQLQEYWVKVRDFISEGLSWNNARTYGAQLAGPIVGAIYQHGKKRVLESIAERALSDAVDWGIPADIGVAPAPKRHDVGLIHDDAWQQQGEL